MNLSLNTEPLAGVPLLHGNSQEVVLEVDLQGCEDVSFAREAVTRYLATTKELIEGEVAGGAGFPVQRSAAAERLYFRLTQDAMALQESEPLRQLLLMTVRDIFKLAPGAEVLFHSMN